MLDDSRMKKAIELGHQATALDREGKFQEALDVYKLSIEHFMLVWKYEQNPSFKQRLEVKIDEYLRRAEQIKTHIDKKVRISKKSDFQFLFSKLFRKARLIRTLNQQILRPGRRVTLKTTS